MGNQGCPDFKEAMAKVSTSSLADCYDQANPGNSSLEINVNFPSIIIGPKYFLFLSELQINTDICHQVMKVSKRKLPKFYLTSYKII